MRISDWSSDVCSSDLQGADVSADPERSRDASGLRLRFDHDCRAADPQPRRALRSLQHDGDFRDEWGRRSGGADRTIGRSVQLAGGADLQRSEEHTSELQSLMRISYAVFCLKKKKSTKHNNNYHHNTHTFT